MLNKARVVDDKEDEMMSDDDLVLFFECEVESWQVFV